MSNRHFFIIFCFFLSAQFLSANEKRLNEANWLYFHGNPKEALRLYQNEYSETGSTEAALNTCLVSLEVGLDKAGCLPLEEAISKNPDNNTLRVEAAWRHINQGEAEKALSLLSGLKPGDDPLHLLTLGRLAIQTSDTNEARVHFGSLTEQSPHSTLPYYFLGQTAEKEGQHESAIDFYERLLKEDSHFVAVRPILARLHEELNHMDDAWKQYARVSYADDRNQSAKENMRRLAPFISAKPNELIPPKSIGQHTVLPPFAGPPGQPTIKVGIGTTSSGQPSIKKSVSFRTSQPFIIWDPETKKTLMEGLKESTWTIRLEPREKYAEIIDQEGRLQGRFWHTITIRQSGEAPTTILNALEFAKNTSWGGMADKEIRGEVQFILNHGRKTLVVVNLVSLEEYIYGVLAAEMPVHWPLEALKTQAVMARTQGLYRRNLHKRYGYDVCDEQHCQVYGGVGFESKKVWQAVDETKGEYLYFEGRAAHTVFSSNCGGMTQTGSQAGWGNVPYWPSIYDGKPGTVMPHSPAELRVWLRQTPPAFCEGTQFTWYPEYRWSNVVLAKDIAKKLSRKKPIGQIKGVEVLERNETGRVRRIRFRGTKRDLILSKEHEIRSYLGLGSIRSTLFAIDTVFANGMPDSFFIFGGGWGHGVGFCQSGAAGRADAGANYKEIIKAYFPKLTLKKY